MKLLHILPFYVTGLRKKHMENILLMNINEMFTMERVNGTHLKNISWANELHFLKGWLQINIIVRLQCLAILGRLPLLNYLLGQGLVDLALIHPIY